MLFEIGNGGGEGAGLAGPGRAHHEHEPVVAGDRRGGRLCWSGSSRVSFSRSRGVVVEGVGGVGRVVEGPREEVFFLGKDGPGRVRPDHWIHPDQAPVGVPHPPRAVGWVQAQAARLQVLVDGGFEELRPPLPCHDRRRGSVVDDGA